MFDFLGKQDIDTKGRSTKQYSKAMKWHSTSTCDPCFLISKIKECFGIICMQTDDTLGLTSKALAEKEDKALEKAGFPAKLKEYLSVDKALIFNGGILTLSKEVEITFTYTQKNQADKIELIDVKTPKYKEDYRRQQAKGAYIAAMCQPEALRALSQVAQISNPIEDDAQKLNQTLKWLDDNKARGLKIIGYMIIIGNEIRKDDEEFEIRGRNGYACIDSRSLYDCIVKLSTTTEKRLMIDIIALQQAYDVRDLDKVKWIVNDDNPVDAITKGTPNKSFTTSLDTNKLTVRLKGWVDRRKKEKQMEKDILADKRSSSSA
ncbi:uncharacterized protein LY89DRAFT_703903 [Mollisia scopiformis]|uniref:Uncharacterized protein n=1 Tax=Mollisia scopiformis TaxID=149040 RepID=A0A194XTM8_MOLSC|nr:uncharacterized protein LY89DRAFT_703903 [Mollisia scopiformis]KUJ23399.1 hypothetical protein LY89DRAFT_703903 [Mollisia scopiformis]